MTQTDFAHSRSVTTRHTGVARLALSLALLAVAPAARSDEPPALPPAASEKVDFERHIAPIFQAHCLNCHGPNKQESGFRLDQEAAARKGGDLGEPFIPGDSANSPLVQYVAGVDENIVMPPKGERLTKGEVSLLRAWIDQGAKWAVGATEAAPQDGKEAKKNPADHWAFQRPTRPALPAVQQSDWPRNEIDHFVLARLEHAGLKPAPEADRYTLLRRLSLDLTGLPPTLDEMEAFVNDRSPDAYQRLVERLLASPHYGERWALWWLDAARYADTNGYEVDRPRSIWPYRDWVIGAFNADMPFNQFTIEQLAGDMLPRATLSQRIATGFHRNTYMNEEGGHNWEQFRWESIVDRVHTTSTVFLGLTMACAQCHDHKYDPISQREYYEFFAFLNNCDEPHVEATQPKIAQQRAEILGQIARLEADLENRFPADEERLDWTVMQPVAASRIPATTVQTTDDGFFVATHAKGAADDLEFLLESDLSKIDALKIEVLSGGDDATGTGTEKNRGNAVLVAEFDLKLISVDQTKKPQIAAGADSGDAPPNKTIPVEIRVARDHLGRDLTAQLTDGKPKTGWRAKPSASTAGNTAQLVLDPRTPISFSKSSQLVVHLRPGPEGASAALRFRISAAVAKRVAPHPELPADQQRSLALKTKFEAWRREAAVQARHWTVLEPQRFRSKNNATLSKLDDGSLLLSGDRPEVDSYEVVYRAGLGKITGLKLEALPDSSLPEYGPGRGSVMEDGTFLLSEITVTPLGPEAKHDAVSANAKAADATAKAPDAAHGLRIARASATYAHGSRTIDKAIDGDKLTGWHVQGGAGRRHCAVFELAEPLGTQPERELRVTLLQNFVHQQTLGRFRLWATSDDGPLVASDMLPEVEEALTRPVDRWSGEDEAAVRRHFLLVCPELAEARREIDQLRRRLPKQPTTLVLEERTTPRPSHQHIRGDFNRPGKEVQPNVPAFLPPLADGAGRNRLALARWLVDEKNPLVGRVTMNRVWQAYFGRGVVTTPEDFGTQGASPSHRELLDWLACEWMAGGWSLKHVHRLIVTSAAYRQSSAVTKQKLEIDPDNALVSRGPRFRIQAEEVRDLALVASGLLNPEIGGPSVYPPQPDGVTDLAFSGFRWPTSKGPDRYRRGLYTFRKRATPYASFAVFDAPQQSTCTVRRVRTNTPLQALSMLNDEVIVEAAQAVARRVCDHGGGSDEEKLRRAFQLCLSRPPGDDEQATLISYVAAQRRRLAEGGVDAARISGVERPKAADSSDSRELAAWTLLARVLLNLDETLTKE